MHRSGTSAVAGFLAKAGFFAGEEDDLLPAAEDNPKGFFERADVNALNDALLERLGGNWDRPPGRTVVAERTPAWRPEVDEVLGTLAAEAAGRPLVLKDPRISLLLPAWLPALDDRFEVILVDRNPIDVALSVRKRDRRPLYVALALWQLYCTELLEGLAGKRVLVVRYENFVEGPAGGRQLLERLGERIPANGSWRRTSERFCVRRYAPSPDRRPGSCPRTGPHNSTVGSLRVAARTARGLGRAPATQQAPGRARKCPRHSRRVLRRDG